MTLFRWFVDTKLNSTEYVQNYNCDVIQRHGRQKNCLFVSTNGQLIASEASEYLLTWKGCNSSPNGTKISPTLASTSSHANCAIWKSVNLVLRLWVRDWKSAFPTGSQRGIMLEMLISNWSFSLPVRFRKNSSKQWWTRELRLGLRDWRLAWFFFLSFFRYL